MKLLELNPLEIWSYYPCKGPLNNLQTKMLAAKISKDGWLNIPPVPVFKIPEFEDLGEYTIEHKYIMMDGSHRRNAAIQLQILLPCALYQYEEKVLVRKHHLAPSLIQKTQGFMKGL